MSNTRAITSKPSAGFRGFFVTPPLDEGVAWEMRRDTRCDYRDATTKTWSDGINDVMDDGRGGNDGRACGFAGHHRTFEGGGGRGERRFPTSVTVARRTTWVRRRG